MEQRKEELGVAAEAAALAPFGLSPGDGSQAEPPAANAVSAAEMALILVARVRERRDMRDKMPGDVNATLCLELAALVCSLNDLINETLGQPAENIVAHTKAGAA